MYPHITVIETWQVSTFLLMYINPDISAQSGIKSSFTSEVSSRVLPMSSNWMLSRNYGKVLQRRTAQTNLLMRTFRSGFERALFMR